MTEETKVAVVTGGSRGIGRAICVELAGQGYHVIVNYSSRADAAEETVALCEQAGGTASIAGFNVADSEAVAKAFEEIKAERGRVDVLVNNAGITKDGLMIRTKDEAWQSVIDVNLSGPFYCCRAVAKIMSKARTGRIINISSVVGEMGNAGQVNYVSSKAGLIGMTKTLARELAARSITVNAVTPGFVSTDMTAGLDEKVKEEHMKVIPLKRYGEAEDIASAVGFLASDKAGYITGQVLGINGGMYM